jgi:hypothetical protein
MMVMASGNFGTDSIRSLGLEEIGEEEWICVILQESV